MFNDDDEVPKSGRYDDDSHHHHDAPHPSLSRIEAEVKELKKQMIEINVESPLTERSWQMNLLAQQQQQSVQNEFLQEQKEDGKCHYERSDADEGYDNRVEQRPDLKEQTKLHTATSRIKSSKPCNNGPLCRLEKRGLCVFDHSSNKASYWCRYGNQCRKLATGTCSFMH